MDINDRRGMKAEAKRSIAAASYDPRKLIVIHTGASMALSLVLVLIDYLLGEQIGSTGGLSGVGMRSILETAQSVLYVAQVVALLFWQIGYVFVALQISRGRPVGPGSLLEGFRNIFPVLRLKLLLGIRYMGMMFLCVYLASFLFSMTPLAEPFTAAYEAGTEEALMLAMEECMVPMLGVTLITMLVIMVPYLYRLRLADMALMDEPKAGASMAIRRSRDRMRGNRMNLLKLDISFWWFWLIEALAGAVAYGDVVLPMLGVELPWGSLGSYYVFAVLACLLQLALYWWRGNEVQVTYAKFYETLNPKEKELHE